MSGERIWQEVCEHGEGWRIFERFAVLYFTNVSFACPGCMLKYAILTQNRVEICNQFDIRRYLRYCRGKWESQFNSFLHGVIIACIELEETR
jgi:hypothetical protein